MGLRGVLACLVFVEATLAFHGASRRAPSPRAPHSRPVSGVVRAAKDAAKDESESAFGAFLSKAQFLAPLGFVAQICFLVASNFASGPEALAEYGRLGNAYIRERTDYKTMPRTTIFRIQTEGQQIWWNNVLRDLENGRPVSPPIAEPFPKYELGRKTT